MLNKSREMLGRLVIPSLSSPVLRGAAFGATHLVSRNDRVNDPGKYRSEMGFAVRLDQRRLVSKFS
jgi:hypothetical protein